MAAYPSIKIAKDFQVTIKDPCDINFITAPLISDVSNEVFVSFTKTFALARNISTYCGTVTYTYNWVSASQSVVA
jgi:hypothetical protein